jgi:outer membrane usher protein
MPVGIMLVWIGNSDVLIKLDDLTHAGVVAKHLRPRLLRGVRYISIADIGSSASFKLDPGALTLAITLPPADFVTSRFDLSNSESFDVQRPTHSGFLNYAVGDDSSGAMRFEGEAAVNLAGGMLDTLVRRDTTTGRIVGDDTSFTVDHPNSGRHDQVGVVPVVADDFAGTGGSLRFVGASVSRNGPLNQTLRQSAGNSLSGIALAASTVDIYVNGILVQRQEIPPGAFQLSNLPLQSGQNDTTVVVRDVFGRTQTYGSSLYRSADILQRGDRTYQFAVGKEINDYGLNVPSRPTDAVARYEYGLSDHLTAGGRIVAGTDLTNIGLNAAFSQRYGEFAVSVAASSAAPLTSTNTAGLIDASFVSATPAPVSVVVAPGTRRVTGDAIGATYTYVSRRIGASASYVYQSPLYATLAHAALSDRPTTNLQTSLSYILGRGRSVGIAFNNVAYRDAGTERELSAHYGMRIGSDADLYAGLGTRQYLGKTGPDATLRLNFGVGHRVSALIS